MPAKCRRLCTRERICNHAHERVSSVLGLIAFIIMTTGVLLGGIAFTQYVDAALSYKGRTQPDLCVSACVSHG